MAARHAKLNQEEEGRNSPGGRTIESTRGVLSSNEDTADLLEFI